MFRVMPVLVLSRGLVDPWGDRRYVRTPLLSVRVSIYTRLSLGFEGVDEGQGAVIMRRVGSLVVGAGQSGAGLMRGW